MIAYLGSIGTGVMVFFLVMVGSDAMTRNNLPTVYAPLFGAGAAILLWGGLEASSNLQEKHDRQQQRKKIARELALKGDMNRLARFYEKELDND